MSQKVFSGCCSGKKSYLHAGSNAVMLYRAHTYSVELFKFHDFFHDLLYVLIAVTFQNFQNVPCSRLFFGLTQFNRHELWFPPKCKL